MTVTLHALALETFIPRLQTLDGLLERGAAQIDPAALVDARLAPDMYPLAKQVQIVCYQAIDAVTVLRGEDPPTLETPAETLEQLRRRIAATIDALREVPADALAGAEDRKIERPIGEVGHRQSVAWHVQLAWLRQARLHLVAGPGFVCHSFVFPRRFNYQAGSCHWIRSTPACADCHPLASVTQKRLQRKGR